MKFFINTAGDRFAFDSSDSAEFIARYADQDWQQVDILPERVKSDDEIAQDQKVTKDSADATAAKADAKLTALGNMSPAQVRAWVGANVANLADAKDVLATLAVAVSILSRRL